MAPWLFSSLAFVMGIILGSFLTVCIHRLPRGQSVVTPRSACPGCGHGIYWFDNIPLVSFMLLRGQCRNCRIPIPYRYPFIELINGIGYVLLLRHFGLGWPVLLYGLFFSALLAVTWIDWDFQMIPDVITIPGMVLGLIASTFILPVGFWNALIGLLVGGGILFLLAWLSPFVFGKEGLGGGDIKLLAMVGAFLGWQPALLTLFLASILGAGVGLGLMGLKMLARGQYMPFGPFLAVGAMTSLLYSSHLIHWYLGII